MAPQEEVMMKVNEENKSSVTGIVAIVASLIYPFFINPFGGPGVAFFLGFIPFSVSLYAIFKGNAKLGFVAITVTVIVLVSSQSLSWQRSYESSASYQLDQATDRASRSIDRYLKLQGR